MNLRAATLLLALFAPAANASNKIDENSAAQYALHAMVASNSYHKDNRKRFPVELMGWNHIGLDGMPTTKPTYRNMLGLAFDVYKKSDRNEYIFVYRGTDSKLDYLSGSTPITFFMAPQYKSANKRFRKFIASVPKDSKVTIVGHSLGGGLALSSSVKYGYEAIVFDSSPRVFDGLGDNHIAAKRTSIYQSGEILQKIRPISTKYPEVVSEDDTYVASFDFGNVSPHSSHELAKQLLKLGATISEELRTLDAAME